TANAADAAKQSATQAFLSNFAYNFALGLVNGEISIQVAKGVQSAICGDKECSDDDKIIVQAVTSVLTAITSTVVSVGFSKAADTLLKTESQKAMNNGENASDRQGHNDQKDLNTKVKDYVAQEKLYADGDTSAPTSQEMQQGLHDYLNGQAQKTV